MGDIPTATKQAAGNEGGSAGFLVHVSKSNFNNLERALKKFKASIVVSIWRDKCTSNSSYSDYSLKNYQKPLENKALTPHHGFYW